MKRVLIGSDHRPVPAQGTLRDAVMRASRVGFGDQAGTALTLPACALALALALALSALACAGDGEGPEWAALETARSALTVEQRLARYAQIRDAAAARGIEHTAYLLGGIAYAETGLAHCWSEAQWACQGPASPDCGGGPVIAGAGDGPCADRQGGLGMFQFDSGTFDDTLAAYGPDVLTVAGNVGHALDYVIRMVWNSAYTPNFQDEGQALQWLQRFDVNDAASRDQWISTVTHYYNGCRPEWGCWAQRYPHYDNSLQTVLDETGLDFWEVHVNRPPWGSLDAADCTTVRGWAQDPDTPDAPIDVHLYFDGPAGASPHPAIAVRADLHRDDLCGSIGSCAHGFELYTPHGLCDGRRHEVRAYGIDAAGGNNPELQGGRREFTCPPPAMPLPPERAVRRHVANAETFFAWGFSTLDVQRVDDAALDIYPIGASISAGPTLWHLDGSFLVYLIDEGRRRWVGSGEAMRAWHFRTVDTVPQAQLDAVPEGVPLLPEPALVQGSGPEVWLIDERPEGGVSIPEEESAIYDSVASSDVDGDGLADICGRSAAGFSCWLSGSRTFVDGPALSDEAGWGDVANWSTIRMADVTGDGLADVCARSDTHFLCWPSTGEGFGEPLEGPGLRDEGNWHWPRYRGTIRLLDFTGDGLTDLCARGSRGVVCWPSTGQGFGEALDGPPLSDELDWGEEDNWATLLAGDVTGDGRDDLCARSDTHFLCWPSSGDGFGEPFAGPELAAAGGWNAQRYWATIRLADVTGDGLADLCARDDEGLSCWPSTGAGFGDPFAGPAYADLRGWGDPSNYRTIRLADLDGDGRADVCARANAGLGCWLSDGRGFPTSVPGPDWGDEAGWSRASQYATLRIAGGRRCSAEVCNGLDDDCDGEVDEGCAGDEDAGVGPDAGAGDRDAGGEPDLGRDPVQDAGTEPGTPDGGIERPDGPDGGPEPQQPDSGGTGRPDGGPEPQQRDSGGAGRPDGPDDGPDGGARRIDDSLAGAGCSCASGGPARSGLGPVLLRVSLGVLRRR